MQNLTDFRDNRGKIHDLALVMTGFLLAVLRLSGELNLAKIHRMMIRDYDKLCQHLELKPLSGCISYSQLYRLLPSFNLEEYNSINERYLGLLLTNQGLWSSIDGKELRGTIDGVSGQKRGQNMVRLLDHEDKQGIVIGFYQGDKESEKTIVTEHFRAQSSLNQSCYTMDALHTNAPLLSMIENKGGFYLSQVKANQKNLLQDCEQIHQQWSSQWSWSATEKGHGRLEHRKYFCYKVTPKWFAPALWESQITTLIVVERQRLNLKTGKESRETAFFVSNKTLGQNCKEIELAMAVRNHWSIEADHWVRDVGFGEDKIKCSCPDRSKALAASINYAINLIRRNNTMNSIQKFREEMTYDFQIAINCFDIGFL